MFQRTFAGVFGITLALLMSVAASTAQSERRFPHSHITPAQWQAFLDEVKAKPGVQNISKPEQPGILALSVQSENTLYFFTNGGPAHPAVVVEQIIQDGGNIGLQHTGYFAGSEDAFAKWFNAFRARAAAVRESMKSRPSE